MKFDYLELLTVKAALEFTQNNSDGLDLSDVIRKVDELLKEEISSGEARGSTPS